MANSTTAIANKVAWVDLSSTDPAASREFYAKLFGWNVKVNPDPQYGGYALAKVGGDDVAGIGGTMAPGQPTVWNLYIGTSDAAGVASKVQAAGGTVVAPPFAVETGPHGGLQDPSGAFISAWEPQAMPGFKAGAAGSFAWAELSARGLKKAVPFYSTVFAGPPGQPDGRRRADVHRVPARWRHHRRRHGNESHGCGPRRCRACDGWPTRGGGRQRVVSGGAGHRRPRDDAADGLRRRALRHRGDSQGAPFGLLKMAPRAGAGG